MIGFPGPHQDRPGQIRPGRARFYTVLGEARDLNAPQYDPRAAAEASWIYLLLATRCELENSYPDLAGLADFTPNKICCQLHLLISLAEHGELLPLSRWAMPSLQLRGAQLVFAPGTGGPLQVIDVELTTWFSIEQSQVTPTLGRLRSLARHAMYRAIACPARIRGT